MLSDTFFKILFAFKPLRVISVYILTHVTHRNKGIPDAAARALPLMQQSKAPWTRNSVPLASSTVAIVTTGGFFVKGQAPFKEGSFSGDFGFRAIPKNVSNSMLSVSKRAIDRRMVMMDPNIVFPFQRLNELKERKIIKNVGPSHYSFYAYSFDPNRVCDGSGKDVARRLRYEGVDKVLVIPSSVLSQEIAILVQRAIEDEGIPTVSLVYTEEAAAALKPPRACLFAKESLFRMEEYLDPSVQRQLVEFMLAQFDRIQEPGEVMPYRMNLRGITGEPTKLPPVKPASPTTTPKKDLFE